MSAIRAFIISIVLHCTQPDTKTAPRFPRFLSTTFTSYVLENEPPGPTNIKVDVIVDAEMHTTLAVTFDQAPCKDMFAIEGVLNGSNNCKHFHF